MTAGRFDMFEKRAWHGMGGGANDHGENGYGVPRYGQIHHGRTVVLPRPRSVCSTLTCWFLQLTGWISAQTPPGLGPGVLVPEAATGRRLGSWNRRGGLNAQGCTA